MRHLALRSHLRAEVVPGDATYLVAESGMSRLPGREVAVVVPLLDGTRDLGDLCRDVGDRLSAVEVGQVVGSLVRAGFAQWVESPAHPPGDAAESTYWNLAGSDATAARTALARSCVEVVSWPGGDGAGAGAGDDHDAADAVVTALASAGLTAVRREPSDAARPAPRDGAGPSLTVVLTSDYLEPRLAVLARDLAAAGRRWLPARVVAAQHWIGPVVSPDADDACWTCVAARLATNRVRTVAAVELAEVRPPLGRTALTVAVGAHHVALLASRLLVGLAVRADEIVVHDTLAADLLGGVGRHRVPRRPQCPDCGDPGLVAGRTTRPVVVGSPPKVADGGTGGARSRSSADTLAAYRHLVDPVTGVVPELRREERAPDGMHVYLAGLNVATSAAGAAGRRALRQLCGGKGVTDVDARTSALCEALERYSGQWHGDELRRRARFVDLTDALHPNEVMLFDDRQYAAAHGPTASSDGGAPAFDRVPDRFDPHAEIDWTPVWSLVGQRHVQLPTSMLYYDLDGVTRGGRYVVADSNGNAAGSSVADAVLQGFFELVERDAVAIWWYNRTRRPAVDLDAAGERWVLDQRDLHDRLGRELVALDVTSDLGVPVVAAVSSRRGAGPADICLGFGAHLDPVVALRRAVAEVAQLIPAALPGDGRYGTDDAQLTTWWQTATPATHDYLVPDPGQAPVRRPYAPSPDLGQDVARVVAICRDHGLDLLVLDQTRPDVGLPVVKVLVPGLRHFWPRFAPGRLFDVPVGLGQLAAPRRYAELNPQPIFL